MIHTKKHLHVFWVAKTSGFLGTNYTSLPWGLWNHPSYFCLVHCLGNIQNRLLIFWHWVFETCLSFLFRKKCFSDYTSNYMLTVVNFKKKTEGIKINRRITHNSTTQRQPLLTFWHYYLPILFPCTFYIVELILDI